MTIERTQENTESTSVETETPASPGAPADTTVERSSSETDRTEVKTGDSDDGA